MMRIITTDGQALIGKLVRSDTQGVEIELVSGGRVSLPKASVRSMEEEKSVSISETGELQESDPNRTRYFYSPSAMMLRQGESYFSQKELLFSAFAYGITDNISVLVGTAVPLWFLPNGQGINLIGAVKAGVQMNSKLHLAAGVETLYLPGMFSGSGGVAGGFGFGALTVGSPDAHFTVAAGRPFAFNAANGYVGDVLVTLNGNQRVHKHVALMTENWLLPNFTSSSFSSLHAAGTRILIGRAAVDLGLIFGQFNGTFFPAPLPWLDFTYNFG